MQEIFRRCFGGAFISGLGISMLVILLSGCTDHLYAVNKRVNSYKYIPPEHNGKLRTPEEFYRDGGGNCKDFANVKYQELLKAGYKNMSFITILQTETEEEGHMVLEVDGWVLDNMHNSLVPGYLVTGTRINHEVLQLIAEKM